MFLHPSSIVFELKYFPSPFMVYQEKVKTSKIFIRDCCVIPAIPLVLFSGFDVNINIHNGITYLELDDKWIMFEAEEHKVCVKWGSRADIFDRKLAYYLFVGRRNDQDDTRGIARFIGGEDQRSAIEFTEQREGRARHRYHFTDGHWWMTTGLTIIYFREIIYFFIYVNYKLFSILLDLFDLYWHV